VILFQLALSHNSYLGEFTIRRGFRLLLFDWDNLASIIGVEGFEGCLFALDITVGL
jgi:hypothetical protein